MATNPDNTYSAWSYGGFTGHMVSFTCRCVDVDSGEILWTLDGKIDVGPMGPIDPARGLQRILDDAMPKLKSQLKPRGESAAPSRPASPAPVKGPV